MGDYLDGKKGQIQIPVPGRPQSEVSESKTVITNSSNPIDVDSLVGKIVKALGNKVNVGNSSSLDDTSTFNNESSMSKIADAMSINRSKSESNFDNLGNVQKTKKDSKETSNTIDILANLED